MIYLTGPRAELLEEMILYGPRSYDHAHRSWVRDLRVMQRHGLVGCKAGLWRVTKKGKTFFVQRTGVTWVK